MNIDKAIEFVRTNGNKYEQARLNHLLGLEFDRNSVLNGFAILQNPDGGFPFGDIKGFPSCLSNTAMALHNLTELGLADSEVTQKCVKFLQEMQTEKGIWHENDKIAPHNPPVWDMPGDELTALWLTADISELLLRNNNRISETTIEYLKNNQYADGKFRGYIHTHWIALSLFGKKGLYDETVYLRTLRFLEKADTGDWDTSCIAWCLESMKFGEVDRDSVLWKKLLNQLTSTQEPDGSWPSEDGDYLKVRETNSVLRAVWDIISK